MERIDDHSAARRNAFAAIYAGHDWLGESRSGPGSDPKRTRSYRGLIQTFLRDHQIKTVLDIGCGDWSFGRLIDWSALHYTGVDVVEEVVEANRARYGAPNVAFACLDAVNDAIPAADLVLVKEVMQHLPVADIEALLTKLAAYPFAIVVNDISHEKRDNWRGRWRWRSVCSTNTDIGPGGYRLLDLRQPPFSVAATRLLAYENQYRDLRWVKEVLLLAGDATR